MKTLIMLLALSSLIGCLPEEDCYETDEIIRWEEKTNYYTTYMEPVYKWECE